VRNYARLLEGCLQVFNRAVVVFGVNDVYDYPSDLRNPRKAADGFEGTILHPIYHEDVLRTAYVSTVFIILSALLTGTLSNIGTTLLLVLLGWQYSAPPLRLKEVPILDSISNGAIVSLAWLVGFTVSGSSVVTAPTKGYMLGLCTAGVHALGAVVDAEADRTAGQRTIATALGRQQAALFAALC
jgi:4-hydroxybenzoate polyprenyltransferase